MLTFIVNDMTCGHCAKAITQSVQAVDPTATLDIDTQSKLVKVTSSQNQEVIKKAISDAGYHPVAA